MAHAVFGQTPSDAIRRAAAPGRLGEEFHGDVTEARRIAAGWDEPWTKCGPTATNAPRIRDLIGPDCEACNDTGYDPEGYGYDACPSCTDCICPTPGTINTIRASCPLHGESA